LNKKRILIATHAPLSPEFGAGQMAMNLGKALQDKGHDVTLWSPYPMKGMTRWWQKFHSLRVMRSKFDDFLRTQNTFDVIDCYSPLLTKQASKSSPIVIARSMQPEILYMASQLHDRQSKDLKSRVLLPLNLFFMVIDLLLLFQTWIRASYILCLGSLELEWMKNWFPWWKSKLFSYNNALSATEQEILSKIRLSRQPLLTSKIRFIWIGRWVSHKGVAELVDFIMKRAAANLDDTFTIAGCGHFAEKSFPSDLLSSGRVRINPSFDRNQLYKLLAEHDVGLFTSRVEGWGLVLNEMLESGMPVFATDTGGAPDLKPSFKTMLQSFPPKLDSEIDIEHDFSGIENYYQKFSWPKIAENYIEILTSNSKLQTTDTQNH
jgi:glycosyltransferase involved in cell wall biosynthesis